VREAGPAQGAAGVGPLGTRQAPGIARSAAGSGREPVRRWKADPRLLLGKEIEPAERPTRADFSAPSCLDPAYRGLSRTVGRMSGRAPTDGSENLRRTAVKTSPSAPCREDREVLVRRRPKPPDPARGRCSSGGFACGPTPIRGQVAGERTGGGRTETARHRAGPPYPALTRPAETLDARTQADGSGAAGDRRRPNQSPDQSADSMPLTQTRGGAPGGAPYPTSEYAGSAPANSSSASASSAARASGCNTVSAITIAIKTSPAPIRNARW
jgi:hypothetical protein